MSRNQRFFIRLFVFLLLALVVNAGLNKAYDRWMYYFRLSRYQDKQFEKFSGPLKYLMLGNSHNRINPEILGQGFCYMTPKEVYTQTYYKLKYILEKTNKRPEHVLLSIDPVNFSPRAEYDLSFDGYWRKYLDYPELVREFHDPGYYLNWASGNFFSYVGNYKFIYMSVIFRKVDMLKIKSGYIPPRNYKNFAKETNRDALGLEIARAYLSTYSKNSTIGEARFYCKILSLCKQYHIHLILLRMPMTDEYLKYARKMIDIESLDRQIAILTRQHSDDFRIFDYRNAFHGRPDYFFNADHVNPVGAMIISRKIKEVIEGDGSGVKPDTGTLEQYVPLL
jgi:hypothetical protein